MGALDELLVAWRRSPTAKCTLALCAELGVSGNEAVVREVGASAQSRHASNPDVMVAVGRMYLALRLLNEAQTALVLASKADPREPLALRVLGEVLLRRGDAARAEKVVQRAVDLGASDRETQKLLESAASYVALQKRAGVQAVASEFEKVTPGAPVSQPSRRSVASTSAPRTAPAPSRCPAGDPPLPRFKTEDSVEVSEVYELAGKAPAPVHVASRGVQAGSNLAMGGARAPTGKRASRPPPAALGAPRSREPSFEDVTELVYDVPSLEDDEDDTRDPRETGRVELPSFSSFDEVTTGVSSAPRAMAGPSRAKAPAAAPYAPPPATAFARSAAPLVNNRPASVASLRSQAAPPPVAPASLAPLRSPAAPPPTASPASPSVFRSPAAPAVALPTASRPALPPRVTSSPAPGLLPDAHPLHDSPDASSELILEHLVRVGVYEPTGGVKPAWESPPRQKARGIVPLLLAIVLVGGAGGGGYAYTRKVKLERAGQAHALANEVDRLLHSGRVSELRATDAKLSRAFDLDSRSRKAARLWLENRVLGALLLGDEPRGLDSAIYRGREAGLQDRELAVGRVASFLVEGDLAGAAALLPKWDGAAGKDAHYQLASGSVLERAGDPRAVDRYAQARLLDPRLLPADMLLARLLLLEQGVQKARPVIDELAKKAPASPSLRALEALAWVVDPERPAELPAAAHLLPEDSKDLPAPLRAVPSMLDAMAAIRKSDGNAASAAIDAALEHTMGPALAASLGFLAIDVGNEQLARKAALKALSYAALYPRARTLAARVAVLGGRLDDAQKAVEELDPSSTEVAVVRAVVAYETGDSADLAAAIKVFEGQAAMPAFAALSAAPGVLIGGTYPAASKLEALAVPSIPWGELVAIDTALDTNQLELADKLLLPRETDGATVHLLRLARLRRYQNRLDDALVASQRALANKPTVALLIERALELIEKEQLAPARDVVLRHTALLGPVASWLGVLLDVAAKQPAQMKARLSLLEPPPEEAPVYYKVLAARALVAASDERARGYVIGLSRRVGKHPDLLMIARNLNGK